eukprot:TRINITY_DN6483_c0_g1_i2.p2 TRINITY_DN6483_c0_g1~~TRINITY_DN6483_c0_g1_i2.p2  ORF type:complete len:408 (+),score=131.47 TRINITY_DN6483_c0_g1_i2:122-1345(+)
MAQPHTYEAYLHEEDAHHVCRMALTIEKGFYERALAEVDPWHVEWNLEEDRLLAGLEHDPPQEDNEWAELYEERAAEHPELFRKAAPSADAMKQRLVALQTSPALARMYQMLRRGGKEKETAVQAANQHALAEMKRVLAKTCPHAREKNVRIRCDGAREVPASEKHLAKASRRMAAALPQQPTGADGVKRISLNSEASPLPDAPSYGAFDESTVRLFTRIAEAPDYVKHKLELDDKLAAARKGQDVAWLRYGEDVANRKEARKAAVSEARAAETVALQEASEKWLEEDIKALTAAHMAFRKTQQAGIDRRYDHVLEEMDAFYAMQEARIKELSAAYEKYVDEYGLLMEKKRVVDETIAGLYDDEHVPKLLILAEVLAPHDMRFQPNSLCSMVRRGSPRQPHSGAPSR